jgi:hypothetical protein
MSSNTKSGRIVAALSNASCAENNASHSCPSSRRISASDVAASTLSSMINMRLAYDLIRDDLQSLRLSAESGAT